MIDNFKSACERNDKRLYEKNRIEEKPIGYIIAFSFGKGAIEEVARLKTNENIIVKLIRVEDIVAIAKKPTLQLTVTDRGKDKKGLQEIELTATAQSEAGIEFYSWDLAYKDKTFKPEILLDKTGQQTVSLRAGIHEIAVKAVDNDGLESIEVIRVKINGVVKINP